MKRLLNILAIIFSNRVQQQPLHRWGSKSWEQALIMIDFATDHSTTQNSLEKKK